VTDTKRMVITHKNEVVVDVPIDPLAEASPEYDRPQKEPAYLKEVNVPVEIDEPKDYKKAICDVLASPTIASKKWVYRQYDHMVMTGSVSLPGDSDAALVRVTDTNKAVSVTANCNSRYCYLNPKVGGMIAVAEGGRNVVCSGATPMAITDCLNFGNPENPEIMWQFVQACDGINEACKIFNTPVVSGNVSLYNETNGESIYPTPTIGMVGLLNNLEDRIPMGFQNEGDAIILLGETFDELGGSEYLKVNTGKVYGECPQLDLTTESQLWNGLLDLNKNNLVNSAHDLSEGGLATALVEAGLSEGLGFSVELNSDVRGDRFLFSESQSRVLISVDSEKIDSVLDILKNSGVPSTVIGKTVEKQAEIKFNNADILNVDMNVLAKAHQTGFETALFKN